MIAASVVLCQHALATETVEQQSGEQGREEKSKKGRGGSMEGERERWERVRKRAGERDEGKCEWYIVQ